MQYVTFTKDNHSLRGYEVTWDTLPDAAQSMGGLVDEHYEGTKFIEIGAFHGVFMEDDFKYEKIFALPNGMILTAGELEEKGYDWS